MQQDVLLCVLLRVVVFFRWFLPSEAVAALAKDDLKISRYTILDTNIKLK